MTEIKKLVYIKKVMGKHQCLETTKRGSRCKNPICYVSKKRCKLHYLHHLHDRLRKKSETLSSMGGPVTNDLWIGSLTSAHHKPFLEKAGIKSILNTSGIEPLPHTHKMYKDLGIPYETFTETHPRTKVEYFLPDSYFDSDFSEKEFLNYLAKGIEFLKTAPKPALIHCHAGINRSASTIAAYMIYALGHSFEDTIKRLERTNKKRGLKVLHNTDFRKTLRKLDKNRRNRRHRGRR